MALLNSFAAHNHKISPLDANNPEYKVLLSILAVFSIISVHPLGAKFVAEEGLLPTILCSGGINRFAQTSSLLQQ